MKYPYAYSAAKAEGLRLQTLNEERGDPSLLEKAAQLGNVDAAYNMARCYRDNGNDAGFRHWLKIADEEGNVDATCELFRLAINPDADWEKIVYYAQRIIAAPYLESDFYKENLCEANLYLLLSRFRHAEDNITALQQRVERYAESGDSQAQELMARLSTAGMLPESTMEVAKKWYLAAANNGNANAQNEYAGLLQENWADKDVHQEVFEWEQKAANAGHRLAQFNLASRCAVGVGIKRDIVKAIKWFELSAQQGNACAMLNLSALIGDIRNECHDCEKSREWLRRAADCGEGNANLSLALLLLFQGETGNILREAGYRLIIGHKICGVETESDWRLAGNQQRLVEMLLASELLRTRMTTSLSFYTSYPQQLAARILDCFSKRAEGYRRQANSDEDGIVVNLHYIGPCNFRCKTCYFPRDNFMLKLDSWKRIVDQIVASVKVKRFNFAGGEPLIASKEFVQGLIDHIHSYGIDISIITNGFCLTNEFVDANKGKIGMIGISVDGTNNDMNKIIGRTTENGETLTNERLFYLSNHIHDAGMRLKINTQVMKPNCREDFHDLIHRIQPEKWKLLRTSIREDVNLTAKEFVVSEREFEDFVFRHKDLTPIVEDADDIKNAYYMVFQYGEFVCVEGDKHRHLMPLMFGDVRDSLNRMPHNEEGYRKRYSDERQGES